MERKRIQCAEVRSPAQSTNSILVRVLRSRIFTHNFMCVPDFHLHCRGGTLQPTSFEGARGSAAPNSESSQTPTSPQRPSARSRGRLPARHALLSPRRHRLGALSRAGSRLEPDGPHPNRRGRAASLPRLRQHCRLAKRGVQRGAPQQPCWAVWAGSGARRLERRRRNGSFGAAATLKRPALPGRLAAA